LDISIAGDFSQRFFGTCFPSGHCPMYHNLRVTGHTNYGVHPAQVDKP